MITFLLASLLNRCFFFHSHPLISTLPITFFLSNEEKATQHIASVTIEILKVGLSKIGCTYRSIVTTPSVTAPTTRSGYPFPSKSEPPDKENPKELTFR